MDNMDNLKDAGADATNLNTCSCSRQVASDSLDKALKSWTATSPPPRHRGSDPVGSWDDLADWYWQYWNEIETDLCPWISNDQIPFQPLRDELVCLYFRHVHPLCPIIDEAEFHQKYYLDGDDDFSFLQCVSLLEFQSMMFAASLHLNNRQIYNTQFTSTFQCHKRLFEIAKTTYHACHDDASPISLTRAALLLSYWSPYNSEQQSNNYWVDQAFEKAQAAGLPEQHHNSRAISPGRSKLIWWCCLLRDRLLAFGLYRLGCFHDDASAGSLVSQEDFGLEAIYPQFMDRASKGQSINNFIRLCELSQVISRILLLQGQRGSGRESGGTLRDIDGSELLEIASLLSTLKEGRQKAEVPNQDTTTTERMSEERIYNMPCQLTQILYNSTILSICLPYTYLSTPNSNPTSTQFSETALQEVRDAVSRIAKTTKALAYKADSNDIPLSIGAWITIPIAVKMVFIQNSTEIEDPEAELQEMRSLLGVLHIMKHRFSGGRFIANVLSAVASHLFLAGVRDSRREVTELLQEAVVIIAKGLAHGVIVPNAKL